MAQEGTVQVVIPEHITTIRLTFPNRRLLIDGAVTIGTALLDYNVKRPGRIVLLTAEQYAAYQKGAYKIRIGHGAQYVPVYMEDTGVYEYHYIDGCAVDF